MVEIIHGSVDSVGELKIFKENSKRIYILYTSPDLSEDPGPSFQLPELSISNSVCKKIKLVMHTYVHTLS